MLSSLPPKPRGAILGLCCCCFSAWTLWGLFLERVIGFFTGQYSAVHFRLPIRIIVFILMCNCFLYYSLTKFTLLCSHSTAATDSRPTSAVLEMFPRLVLTTSDLITEQNTVVKQEGENGNLSYWLKKAATTTATIFQLCPWFVVSSLRDLLIMQLCTSTTIYHETCPWYISNHFLPFWVKFVLRDVPSSVCKQTSKNWNGDNHCLLRILHETFVKNFDLSCFVSYFADYLLHCRRPTILTFESVRICKAEKRSVITVCTTMVAFFQGQTVVAFLIDFSLHSSAALQNSRPQCFLILHYLLKKRRSSFPTSHVAFIFWTEL